MAIAGAVLAGAAQAALAKPPSLDRLFPSGAQRGTTVAVTATGSFDHWPVQGWTDEGGLTIKAEKEKKQLLVTVANDARPGLHWIRLSDEEGATALRPFIVGVLPELVETESENKAITLESSQVTINGRLGRRNDVDDYAIPLKKGQTLVAALEANRVLGSPMDGVLQVASAEGFLYDQNDDDQGFDPRLSFEAPQDGTYHIRLFAFPATPDSTIGFAGGDAYVYRLTLTTGGFLDHGYPLAVTRSNPGTVEGHGWNVPDAAKRLEVTTGTGPSDETASVAHADTANTVDIQLVPHPALTEREPNDSDHAQSIPVPGTVTGRIAPARDQDVYAFQAKKGQVLNLVVAARSLGAPLDPVLRLLDANGKALNDVDDTGNNQRDAQVSFNPPADGTYRISVRDLHGQGGERFVYRLTVASPLPDYRLTLKTDRLTLTPEKAEKLEVVVERQNGFKGPIEVQLDSLPEGLRCPPIRSESGKDTEKAVTLMLTAAAQTPAGPIRVLGKSVEGTALEHSARAPIEGLSATTDRPWITVIKPAAAKTP